MIIACPIIGFNEQTAEGDPVYFMDIPDWKGKHLRQRDEAFVALSNETIPNEYRAFAVSLALAEDWNLPGLSGKPENWDFDELNLTMITWVNSVSWASFNRCFNVSKNSLPPSPNG